MVKSNASTIFTKVKNPFSFANNSTIGCGGYATMGCYPDTQEDFEALLNACKEEKRPFLVVGNMSNVLPPDGYLDKTIICTKKYSAIVPNVENIYVSAGCSVGKLIAWCKTNTKTGAEFLTGIPSTVGGAVYMNAGVSGAYMADIIKAVCIWKQGEVYTIPVTACKYAYKSSIFMEDNCAILGVEIALKNAKLNEIEEKLRYYSDRRAHLPKGKSMGCIFKNPNGESAGKWIEKAGLKGLRRGGAVISTEHANFIINDAGATSQEIKELITIIKNAVYAQYGIQLMEEIRYLN